MILAVLFVYSCFSLFFRYNYYHEITAVDAYPLHTHIVPKRDSFSSSKPQSRVFSSVFHPKTLHDGYFHHHDRRRHHHQQDHVITVFSSLDEFHTLTSSMLTSSVPVFDGSTVQDTVVVSSLYWSNLWNGIVTWLITQFVAGIVFTGILWVGTTQLITWTEYLSSQFRLQKSNHSITSAFLKEGTDVSDSFFVQKNVQPNVSKLALCLLIDLVGSSSELVPILGEAVDFIWAPVAAYTMRSMYSKSNVIFILEFLEEILPFTDFIPFATICWFIETYMHDSELARALQIGKYYQ